MMKTLTAALAFAAGLAALPAAANEITGIYVNPSSARAGESVSITVNGSGEYCGVHVDFGDGSGIDIKVDSDAGVFPKSVAHVYQYGGEYTVTAKGDKVTTHFPCDGTATAKVMVQGASGYGGGYGGYGRSSAGAAAALCPEGWTLVRGMQARDGSFACRPVSRNAPYPRNFTCGAGFVYFERGKAIGCKRTRR